MGLANYAVLEQMSTDELWFTWVTETDVQVTDDPNQLLATVAVVSSDLNGKMD